MTSDEPKLFYFSNINDVCSWNTPDVKSRKISKWNWLWRQFLCVVGFSKRPQMFYGFDLGDEDTCVEVWGFINENGDFEINRIRERK